MGGERDFRNDFSIPFKFTPKNILDFAPVWALDMLFCGVPSLDAFPVLPMRQGAA